MAVPTESMALFHAATRATIGKGKQTLFWEDQWISGFRICELAPEIYERVSRRIRKTRLVEDALQKNTWVGGIGPDLEPRVLNELLHLWPRITVVQLNENVEDTQYLGHEKRKDGSWGWGCRLRHH